MHPRNTTFGRMTQSKWRAGQGRRKWNFIYIISQFSILSSPHLERFPGYLFCRMSRNDVKRGSEIVSFNLTIAAENLYKKAKRIAPKAVHHNGPEKVTTRLLEIFNCTLSECGTITNYNVAEFIKRSIHLKVVKLLKAVNNATLFLDSLRWH